MCVCVSQMPPHTRCGMMELLAQALADSPSPGGGGGGGGGGGLQEKFPTDCLKPLADALISCSEDSDPKVSK